MHPVLRILLEAIPAAQESAGITGSRRDLGRISNLAGRRASQNQAGWNNDWMLAKEAADMAARAVGCRRIGRVDKARDLEDRVNLILNGFGI